MQAGDRAGGIDQPPGAAPESEPHGFGSGQDALDAASRDVPVMPWSLSDCADAGSLAHTELGAIGLMTAMLRNRAARSTSLRRLSFGGRVKAADYPEQAGPSGNENDVSAWWCAASVSKAAISEL